MSHRRNTLRRYPALGFLAIAAGLALILPSQLSNPRSDPASLAEFAPVPGDSEGTSDLSDLSQASSAGVPVGARLATVPSPDGGSGAGPSGRTKPLKTRCIGDPPRQTEDRLSPPCVPFFEGENGGATARGVTGDGVAVVVQLRQDTSDSPPTFRDWSLPPSTEDRNLDQFGKALSIFFNARYQLYNRRINFWAYRGPAGPENPEILREDVARIERQKAPFAFVAGPVPAIGSEEAASRRITTVAYPGFRRDVYTRTSPYLWSFAPDLADQARMFATYVCSRLAGRAARYAVDPVLAARERRFGLVFVDATDQPNYGILRDLIERDLDAGCGVRPLVRAIRSGNAQTATPDMQAAVAAFRTNDVNSVLVVLNGGTSTSLSNVAGTQQWYPEWVLSGGVSDESPPDRNSSGRLHNQTVWRSAFGLTFDYRRDRIEDQAWFQAYREGCPSCVEIRENDAVKLYDNLALLVYGLQAAGPKLTPATFERGLHSIPRHGSTDPYRPAAYFPPGSNSFVKDTAEIWWDTASTAPGDGKPGCYRMTRNGLRSRAEDWRDEDTGLFRDGPCQGNQANSAT